MKHEWEPYNLLPQFDLLVHQLSQDGPYRGEPLPRETLLYGWIVWVLCHPWTMTPNYK
jgi:hypothetical protein